MLPKYSQIKKFLLDILFPVFCLDCNKEGEWLCKTCLKKIQFKEPFSPLEKGSGLDRLMVMTDYQTETVKQMIHLLKYNFAYDLRTAIRSLLAHFINMSHINFPSQTLVIPIPLHKKRLRWRGFNQAQIIGEELAKIYSLKISIDNLRRIKYTQPQVTLDAKARKKNIIDAFTLNNPLEISGQSVILIDDVYTTGSTMNEAAKVLKKAKTKEIIGFVIAQG